MRLLSPKERDIAYRKEKDSFQSRISELGNEFSQILKSYNLTKSDLENFYAKEVELKEKGRELAFKEENLAIRENNARLREESVIALKNECDQLLNQVLKAEERLKNRFSSLFDREIEFKTFKDLQDRILKVEKDKLRDWLAVERDKLRICRENLQA